MIKKGGTLTKILSEKSTEVTPIVFYYKEELPSENKAYACLTCLMILAGNKQQLQRGTSIHSDVE